MATRRSAMLEPDAFARSHIPFDLRCDRSDSAGAGQRRESPGVPRVTRSPGLWLVGAALMPLRMETSLMIQLSDTQAVLLSTAAQRDDGSLLPLPASLKPGGGATKAIGVLIRHGLAEERETGNAASVRRHDGDRCLGLFLTAAGAAAIGVIPSGDDRQHGDDDRVAASAPGKPPRKAAIVLDLLRRERGATLPELIEATGWLPHPTRAALTGLRKRGHEITRGKRDGATCYAVAAR